jgi:peptidyl-prolyl cis-trans isomerase C
MGAVRDPSVREGNALKPRWAAAFGPWPALLLMGTALWGLHRLAQAPEPGTLVVSAEIVAALRDDLVRHHGREPTADELEARLDAWVEEELVVREARAMGLDRADPIVRRRLTQKLRFALEDAHGVDDPGDEVLAAWHREHAELYRRPPRRGFTHVFVAGLDAGAQARVSALIEALDAGADPGGQGDAFAHGSRQGPSAHQALVDRYGDELAHSVAAAPFGRWIAARSRFGWHALRVDDERPGELPPLHDVRARVLADWQIARRAESLEQGLAALRERWQVEVER